MTKRYNVYLDYHATTPVDPRVFKEMVPFFGIGRPDGFPNQLFGNPASNHEWGNKASEAVEIARAQVAKLIGAKPSEIYFTSGATESNNTILDSLSYMNVNSLGLEHSSVLESILKTNPDLKEMIKHIQFIGDYESDIEYLYSLMLANNEVGAVYPIQKIANNIWNIRENHKHKKLFHCDATQGQGYIDFDVSKMPGLHFASLSAHKMYGPKGIGAFYLKDGFEDFIKPGFLRGGGQERGIRAGTLNVPGIVGFGAAAEIMRTEGKAEALELLERRETLYGLLKEKIPGIQLNIAPGYPVLPQTLNVYLPGIDAETLLMALPDLAMSTGSACSADSQEPSHVLKAIYPDEPERWSQSIRMSAGRFTGFIDVEYAASRIIEEVESLEKSNNAKR